MDGYDRAARAPYGRIPGRSRHGDQLRTAARLLAMAGQATGESRGPAGTLIASLMALADAVAGLRQAQAHAAQAAAARQAAEQLHAAFSQARHGAPHPGRGRARASRPGPAGPATTDFSVPLAEILPDAVAHQPVTPGSRRPSVQPPARAKSVR